MKASLAVRAAALALLITPLAGCDLISMASGQQVCSKWTAEKTAGGTARRNQETWAKGFFKSFYDGAQKNPNQQGKNLNFTRDDARLLADLDAYCATHPVSTNGQAAQAAALQEMQSGPTQPAPEPTPAQP